MRATDIQLIGDEMAIKWEDESEGFVALRKLREACPCAACKGETDVMGRLHIGVAGKLTDASYRLVRFVKVGGYAIQPVWGDGHDTGLYPFEYLQRMAGGL